MENNNKKAGSYIKLGLILIGFLYVSSKFRTLMGAEDFTAYMKWWATLLALGLGFLPLTLLMFKDFADKGWLFAKTIGLALSGWLVWYATSLHLMKFTLGTCYSLTVACVVLNYGFAVFALIRDKKKRAADPAAEPMFGRFDLNTVVSVLFSEFVFFLAFLFWTYLRCFKPEILGNTEKFMDYGLMTSIDRTDYMPAEDMWLSGYGINYYYLGQYFAVFVKRLSGVDIKDSYTLALMMVAGFAVAIPYSLTKEVFSDFTCRKQIGVRGGKILQEEKPENILSVVVGLLAGISVCFAGNMHYTIVNGLVINGKMKWLGNLLSITRETYWFPDATRYIGYTPETKDKTIHEFPSYSFVLGDLHAHVINIMFVLTVLGLLYSILKARKQRMDSFRLEGYDSIQGFDIKNKQDIHSMLFGEVLTPQIILIGFFIGMFHMTNYWDFPIYFVVSGAVILFSNAVICKFRKEALILTAAHAAVIIVLSVIVSLPFTLSFDQISTGVAISLNHTPLYQLLVLWGLPVTVVITFLVIMIKILNRSIARKYRKAADRNKPNPARPVISEFCERHPALDWLYRFINSLEVPDLFILTIGLCAAGLVLMPELVYVKDIYSGDYKRANTMFKLTYQAFIMFGMAMPYIMGRLLRFAEFKRQRVFAGITLFLLFTTFGYFVNASTAWFGDVTDNTRYKGLDCTAFLESYYPEDAAACDWINENIDGPVNILEYGGFSYTYYGRISVLTGSATPIGWETHEWLWRSGAGFAKPPVIDERYADVYTIYTSEDEAVVRELLAKYDIDYIYVGLAERYDGRKREDSFKDGYTRNSADGSYYAPLDVNDELLRSIGEIVYQAEEDGSEKDYFGRYLTYIVKVKR